MSHFQLALDKRDLQERTTLQIKVIDWSSLSSEQAKIVSNLYKEHFATVQEMERLIEQLLVDVTLPTTDFMQAVYQRYKNHTRSGDGVRLKMISNQLGFCLTPHTLTEVLKNEHYYDFLLDTTRIEEFLSKKSIGEKFPRYDSFSIKGNDSTIWVTWSNTSDDPFDFMQKKCCEEVYNALALDHFYKSGPVFLFRTTFDKIIKKSLLLRPTVFDAGNYHPFLPASPEFDLHGFTKPYNNGIFLINNIEIHSDPRPEGIIDGTSVLWTDLDHCEEIKNSYDV